MVNLCGKYITQHIVTPAMLPVTLDEWKTRLANGAFFTAMLNQGAFAAFGVNSKDYDDKFRQRLLVLTSSSTSIVDDSDIDEKIAQEGYGDISSVDAEQPNSKTIKLKCELIRQLLIRQILMPPPIHADPPNPFDIVKLLVTALPYFSPSHVARATRYSHKEATTTSALTSSSHKAGDLVPREAVYQVEFFRVLSAWKISGHYLHNEVNASSLSLDFLYVINKGNGEIEKHAIELAASTTNTDLDDHANRGYGSYSLSSPPPPLTSFVPWNLTFHSYMEKMGAVDEVLLHFTPIAVAPENLKFQAGKKHVPVIHIWHSADAKKYKIIQSMKKPIEVTTAAGVF